METAYSLAERFYSIQGEGVYAGTPMSFVRFTGCSVGKKVCHHCDTIFERELSWRGGGRYTSNQLLEWTGKYQHVCLTGGEPADQDLEPLSTVLRGAGKTIHIETSGTVNFDRSLVDWLCVSPKPGFLPELIDAADEIKVIYDGLGTDESLVVITTQFRALTCHEEPKWSADAKELRDTFRWPTLEDALRWAEQGKIVFLQPRAGKYDIDKVNLKYVLDLLRDYPQLRLSCQLHKMLGEQ